MQLFEISETTGLLLVKAAKLHRSIVSDRLARVGLHVGQDLLLLELSRVDGVSQRELADRLGVEQATVGVALRRLESGGFVQRRAAVDDARVRAVFLTERGRDALPAIYAAWREAETALFGRLSAQQAEQLRKLLTAMLAASTPAPEA
ncbi:MAG TPA: MarR family transcriptional regulator [Micromonosporaceae bacterium]|nr:MarR family transcriptional regulator [Micromonosporaceae bacterium]